MAKKDNDNFDFETEGKAKVSFDLSLLKNLTKEQKGIILAAVATVLVVAIIVVCIALGANNNDNSNNNDGTGEGETVNDGTVPDEITKFYISSAPTKTLYYVGDNLDCTGLSVYVKSEELGSMYINYDADPDAFTITGFDSSAPAEEQVITVECQGFTDTFTIKILANEVGQASLKGITIDPLPVTTYKVGDSFDTTGGYIVAEYSDGTFVTVELTMKHIFGFGAVAGTPGEHQIKVKYADDHGGYAETYITITITE